MQYVDRRNALSLMRLIHQHHVPVYDKVMLSGVLPSISIWLRIALCELLPRHSNTLRELPTVRTMLNNATAKKKFVSIHGHPLSCQPGSPAKTARR